MSISTRLAVAVAIVAAILGSLVGVVLYLSVTSTIMGSMKGDLGNTSERVFEQLGEGSLQIGTSRHPRITNDQEYLQVFNSSGALLYGSDLAYGNNRGVPPFLSSRLSGSGYQVIQGRGDGQRYLSYLSSSYLDGNLYRVLVATTMDQYGDTSSRLLELLALGIPAFVIIASISGVLLSRRALRPVEILRVQAEGLLVARAEGRLDVPTTKDELAALARTLNVFLGSVESLLGRQKYFVASASHELRTPLARISADIELALLYGTDAESRQHYLERAATSLVELCSICDELIRLANLESAEIEIETKPVALGTFVLGVLRPFQAVANSLGIDIVLDIEGWRIVVIDESKLSIALANVIDNAISFSAPGASIVISSGTNGDELILAVLDSGPGFPPAFVERALDPFTRPTSQELRSGNGHHAGLGLSIAATIVRLHGSEIEISNRPEGGAMVSITLPLIGEAGASDHRSETVSRSEVGA